MRLRIPKSENDKVVDYERLRDEDFNHDLAEALVGREKTWCWLRFASHQEVMDEFLQWNGIHGYTNMIMSAIQSLHTVDSV